MVIRPLPRDWRAQDAAARAAGLIPVETGAEAQARIARAERLLAVLARRAKEDACRA